MVTTFNDYCIKRPLCIIIIALKLYAKFRYHSREIKTIQTEKFYDNMISFPFKSHMTIEELDYLINSIKSVINGYKKNINERI